MADDVCLRLVIYGIMFILAFWCAAIAAPIMWRLEYDREHWPKTICTVIEWDCCRISCGKSGCSYQPRWIVTWKTNDGGVGERTGSYYGRFDQWYRPRDNAEDRMYDHPINTSFPCQWDPKFADSYRYIAEPGAFSTQAYLIWTIVMYAIGVPFCIIPFIVWLLVNYAKKCGCHCHCDGLCKRRKRPARSTGIAPPMAYTPPAPPQPVAPPAPIPEAPRPDPFAARGDVDVPVNPVLVPLEQPPQEERSESVSPGASSRSGSSAEMPVY